MFFYDEFFKDFLCGRNTYANDLAISEIVTSSWFLIKSKTARRFDWRSSFFTIPSVYHDILICKEVLLTV
jgi:hypothetical protein